LKEKKEKSLKTLLINKTYKSLISWPKTVPDLMTHPRFLQEQTNSFKTTLIIMFFSYTTIIACVCLAGKSMME